MKKSITLASLIVLSVLFSTSMIAQTAPENCNCPSQTAIGKGAFYVAFGYNLDWYTKSDIHFKDKNAGNYDFTLYGVRAKDRPGLSNLFNANVAVPQYAIRLGYYFAKHTKWAIEFNYDHAKYVATNNQPVRIEGQIHGNKVSGDTMMTPGWLRYEHTNGANFAMIDIVRREPLWHLKNQKLWVSAVGKYGCGISYPRTEVYIFDLHRNDHFWVAGFITALDLGVRIDFLKHFFFETSGKGGWVDYTDVLLPGTGRATQRFYSFEYIFTWGATFHI